MRAKFLAEQNYGRLPIAINTVKFAKTVANETGYEISSVVVPMSQEGLRGLLLRKLDKKAIILINSSNNECWTRFVFMKELTHLFLDAEEDFITDAERLADGLVNRELDINVYALDNKGVRAAVEIMIPEELRTPIAHMVNVEKKTSFAIAFLLKIPKKYVEFRLREWDLQIIPS